MDNISLMDKGFFYEIRDYNTNLVLVYNKNYEKIGKVFLNELDTRAMIGCVCFEISKGSSVGSICSGRNWKPDKTKFFRLIGSNSDYKQMYKAACDIRLDVLVEELVALRSDDEDQSKKISNYQKIIKVLTEEKNSNLTVMFNPWVGDKSDYKDKESNE